MSSLSYDTLQTIVKAIALALVVLSASVHEFGHAYAAHKCGDDTAKEQGRLTVNPLAHIDLFGSVLLPALLLLSGSGYMAFAKPVPYNPYRLKNRRRDEVIVAFAGPLANILQACVGAALYHLSLQLLYGDPVAPMYYYYLETDVVAWLPFVLQIYIQVNCSLAFFNLLPIPPLDGSSIIAPLLSDKALNTYYKVQRYALPVTFALIWFLPQFTGIDPIGWWLDLTAGNLETLLLGW